MSVLGHGMVEFPANNKIDVFSGVQGFFGLDVSVRTDEGDFQ